jgi:crotonobetainyl-CoA:carnitine CoA-transferase CaiB-like acyl-CoA transferase
VAELPAERIRVLDLTRVIAGPVGTRTLALMGADVLRVDSPRLPELPAQHWDTGPGKRSTVLDLRHRADYATFTDLLASAHAVVTGYRPGSLDRYGLDPASLVERAPGLVVATISAWGSTGPWVSRRGFDSLVQAATGIAIVEADGDPTPGALPAQALDHGTGYLLAAAVLRGLSERITRGGGWHAELSLAQTAAWLLRQQCPAEPAAAALDPTPRLRDVSTSAGPLRYALPPFTVDGVPETWVSPPVAWGTSAAAWREHAE